MTVAFGVVLAKPFFRQGNIAEAYEYYESWLKDDPQNVDGINSFSGILFENGDAGKAYEVIRKVTWGVPLDAFEDSMKNGKWMKMKFLMNLRHQNRFLL
jgi:tetratricopeptide (TPR) repeat protein